MWYDKSLVDTTNLDSKSKSFLRHMDVSKNRGVSPKIDGENNGKPY